jgi:uncharacterized protein YndB with AHSA1/START domain
MTASVDDQHVLELERTFDAPRELLFEVWSKAEHLEKWFAPDGFELQCTLDFRPGGAFRIRMIGFGLDHAVGGTYREIVRPERIVQLMVFDDLPGHEIELTVTFEQRAGKTVVSVRQVFPPWQRMTPEQAALLRPRVTGSSEGWSQTLRHLGDYVAARHAR